MNLIKMTDISNEMTKFVLVKNDTDDEMDVKDREYYDYARKTIQFRTQFTCILEKRHLIFSRAPTNACDYASIIRQRFEHILIVTNAD